VKFTRGGIPRFDRGSMNGTSRYRLAKRALDVASASAGLVALSPVMAATAAAVWLDSGRPVLFRQQRVGKDGVPFTIHKFRSMLPASSANPSPRGSGDPSGGDESHRVTRVGRFIRRWAIDELPQLVNVIHGQMSLVGPRPLIPEHDGLLNGSQAARRSVLPGMSGWAAVTGGLASSWNDRVRKDLYYVDNASLWLDMAVILLSVPAIASWGEPHANGSRLPE
jgi:lipopolysaccharide/colanic/teichoic acid biosynthesis glycosyltransferase